MEQPINYCCTCGAPVIITVPPGDSVPRHVCGSCGAIHYRNPKLVAGTLPIWEDRILLCRRAIEPRYGMWTLPAGFMENGESLADAAIRETTEEAGARVNLGAMYTVLSVPHISQVHIIYCANLLDIDFAPGEESLEARLFAENEIPWEQLAFRTIAETLRLYFADRRRGALGFHTSAIAPLFP